MRVAENVMVGTCRIVHPLKKGPRQHTSAGLARAPNEVSTGSPLVPRRRRGFRAADHPVKPCDSSGHRLFGAVDHP